MKARMVFIEKLYHQREGQPTESPSRFVRFLESGERPDVYDLQVTATWQELGTSRLKSIGMVKIENVGGHPVELAYAGAPASHTWVIPSGECFRGQPGDAISLRLRCPSGETLCTVHVFPS